MTKLARSGICNIKIEGIDGLTEPSEHAAFDAEIDFSFSEWIDRLTPVQAFEKESTYVAYAITFRKSLLIRPRTMTQ